MKLKIVIALLIGAFIGTSVLAYYYRSQYIQCEKNNKQATKEKIEHMIETSKNSSNDQKQKKKLINQNDNSSGIILGNGESF